MGKIETEFEVNVIGSVLSFMSPYSDAELIQINCKRLFVLFIGP